MQACLSIAKKPKVGVISFQYRVRNLLLGTIEIFDKVDTNNGEEIRYSVIALLAGKWFSVSFIEVWKLTFIVFEIMKNARKNYLSDDN